MGLDVWTGAGTLGLDGILFLADIGLAAGAKMEARMRPISRRSKSFLSSFRSDYWFSFGCLYSDSTLWSLSLYPRLSSSLAGCLRSTSRGPSMDQTSMLSYSDISPTLLVLSKFYFNVKQLYSLNNSSQSKILFFVYHGIAFALGFFYIYIWLGEP